VGRVLLFRVGGSLSAVLSVIMSQRLSPYDRI